MFIEPVSRRARPPSGGTSTTTWLNTWVQSGDSRAETFGLRALGSVVKMEKVIAALAPLGLVAAFSPVSIIAVIAVLFSARARVNGPVFLVGWMASLSLVGSLLLGFGSFAGASADVKPSLVVEIVKLAVGGLALWFAIHKWRTRPRRGEEPPMPGWIARVDALTAARTFLVAVALAAPINPKSLLAVIAAVAVIGNSNLNFAQSWFALAVFVVCASLSIIIAVLSYFIAGQKAERSLTVVRDWLIRNDAVTMTILFGIGGALFLFMGIVGVLP